jgi:hypothetical protein
MLKALAAKVPAAATRMLKALAAKVPAAATRPRTEGTTGTVTFGNCPFYLEIRAAAVAIHC